MNLRRKKILTQILHFFIVNVNYLLSTNLVLSIHLLHIHTNFQHSPFQLYIKVAT